MANISNEISAIQEASRGSEVRQSIVNALNAVNSDVLPVVSSSDSGKFLMVDSSGDWKVESGNLVPAPTETKNITENGLYDVSNYANASVNVSGGSGDTIVSKTIRANGTYYASYDEADGYNPVIVDVEGTKAIPPIMMSSKANNYVSIKGNEISGFTNVDNYFTPLNESGNLLDIDWSLPFEVFVSVKISNTINRSQVLFGALNGFYYAPSIEFGANNSNIWCGFTTNGSSWTNSLNFSKDEISLPLNTEITIKAVWNGTTYSVTVNNGTDELTKSVTPSSAHYHNSNYKIEFGGIAKSNVHTAQYVSMNLSKMYIKNDGVLVWGAEDHCPTFVQKNITANGTYNPADDNADGYSGITVNVSN